MFAFAVVAGREVRGYIWGLGNAMVGGFHKAMAGMGNWAFFAVD
jgi:hypothetical protein